MQHFLKKYNVLLSLKNLHWHSPSHKTHWTLWHQLTFIHKWLCCAMQSSLDMLLFLNTDSIDLKYLKDCEIACPLKHSLSLSYRIMQDGSYWVRDETCHYCKRCNTTRWDLFKLISWAFSTNRTFFQGRKWSLACFPMNFPRFAKSLMCRQRLRQPTMMNLSMKRLTELVLY